MSLVQMNLLQISITGSILILAVIVLRSVLIHHLPKKTFLVLWGIVLLRLLLPYSVPFAYSAYSLLGAFFGERLSALSGIFGLPDLSGLFGLSGSAGGADLAGGLPGGTPSSFLEGASALSEGAGTAVSAIPSLATSTALPGFWQKASELVPFKGKLAEWLGAFGVSQTISVWGMIWCVGAVVCAAFFLIAYLRCFLEFQMSLPVQQAFAKDWQSTHPLRYPWKRRLTIRQSGRISAPLTYGIFRPVILMPKTTDWDDTGTLSYVLLHEYLHICRFDLVWKLVMALAVCIHWFNPLVWVMYLLFHRDIELACDEGVVRYFDPKKETRAAYARILIEMEERKSVLPLYNHFSRNAAEERIVAIMKTKKGTAGAVAASLIVVIAVAVLFATSAKSSGKEADFDTGTVSGKEAASNREANPDFRTDQFPLSSRDLPAKNEAMTFEELQKIIEANQADLTEQIAGIIGKAEQVRYVLEHVELEISGGDGNRADCIFWADWNSIRTPEEDPLILGMCEAAEALSGEKEKAHAEEIIDGWLVEMHGWPESERLETPIVILFEAPDTLLLYYPYVMDGKETLIPLQEMMDKEWTEDSEQRRQSGIDLIQEEMEWFREYGEENMDGTAE